MEDHRLSDYLLQMPVSHLEMAAGCTDRMPNDCDKAAVEACAARYLTEPGANKGFLAKLLLVAAWVGASVPALVERLMFGEVGYEELKALGACLKQGASGPMMELLQVGGRVNYRAGVNCVDRRSEGVVALSWNWTALHASISALLTVVMLAWLVVGACPSCHSSFPSLYILTCNTFHPVPSGYHQGVVLPESCSFQHTRKENVKPFACSPHSGSSVVTRCHTKGVLPLFFPWCHTSTHAALLEM
jgi:hypothetical protein